MFTSDTDRRLTAGIRYLIAAVIVAAAGWLYEMFSHGVYSNFMIYAFMVPLLGGALPSFLMARSSMRGNKKRAAYGHSSTSGSPQTNAAFMLQLAAVITLTAGSLIKGVLDIYGTTNRLIIAYPAIGLALAISSITAYLLQSRSAKTENAA